MSQFNKIPSIIQILVAEWLAVMFVFPFTSKLYERLHPSVAYHSLPLDKADYVFFAIGLLLFVWLLATIFRPAVHETTFIPVFHSGGVYVWNPEMRADYLFSSTHPSYVFIDLLGSSLWWFARWAWSEGWQERTYQGTILIAMAMVIPVLRLFAWYGLRLRPQGDDEVQKEVRNSWKPVALLYSILLLLALVAAAVIIPSERRSKREQARKEASLTAIDSENWNGWQTVSSLREETKENANATRVVRLRALQKSSAAMTCGNRPGQIDFATVVATLGRNDDVLIFSYSGVTGLVQRANGNEGKPIEAIGRLMRMQDNHPAWKKYCGLEELSPKPRWLFEEESP